LVLRRLYAAAKSLERAGLLKRRADINPAGGALVISVRRKP
jgi:hypothetical protein